MADDICGASVQENEEAQGCGDLHSTASPFARNCSTDPPPGCSDALHATYPPTKEEELAGPPASGCGDSHSAAEEGQAFISPSAAIGVTEEEGQAVNSTSSCGDPHSAAVDDEGAESLDDTDEIEDSDAEIQYDVQATEFRVTSTRHDDWLHRGPFLADMPWYVYMMRVRRERKPSPTTADHSEIFFFDRHYSLSALYCQVVKYHATTAIPRQVGSLCPPEEEDKGESHAAYKLMIFSCSRCPGPDHCADPLTFRCLLLPSDKPDKEKAFREKPRFAPSWRARKAEIEHKAEIAATKEHISRKIAVVADTTLMKDRKDSSGDPHSAAQTAFRLRPHLLGILAEQFNKHIESMPQGIVELADLISCFLCGQSLYNSQEQLHLAEFAALEVKKINDAMDLVAQKM